MSLSKRMTIVAVLAALLTVMLRVPALSAPVELVFEGGGDPVVEQTSEGTPTGDESAVVLGDESAASDEATELSGEETEAPAESDEAEQQLTVQTETGTADETEADEVLLQAQASSTIEVSTVDQLMRALDSSSSSVREIIVKPGTYLIGRTLRVRSNMTLTLRSGAIIKRGSLDGPMLMNSATSKGGYSRDNNIIVQGGIWDSANSLGTYASIVHLDHAQGITIKNTTLRNCKHAHTIMLDGINNCTIDNVTFKDDVANTFSFVNEAIHIDTCADASGTPGGTCQPLDGTVSQTITVKGCTFDNVTTAAGCHPHAGPNPENKNLTFCDNTIKKVAKGGSVFNAIRANGVKIYGNNYTGSGAECFVRLQSTKNFEIYNNKANGVKFFAWAYVDPSQGRDVAHGWDSNGRLHGNVAYAVTEAGLKAYEVKGKITLTNEKYYSSIFGKSGDMLLYKNDSRYKTELSYSGCTFARPTVANIPAQAFMGGAKIQPNITVKAGSTTLKAGVDYTVSFRNNTKKGTATATITGKGRYSGSVSKNFSIQTMTPSWSGGVKLPVAATSDIKVTNGGYIRLKSGGKWVTSDSVLSLSSVNSSTKRIKGKRAGSTTLYLLNADGRQVRSVRVTVYNLSGKWEIQSSVDRNYVLDIRGGSKANLARMIVWRRNNSQNQRYQFMLQSDGTYIIKCCHSGKVLDVQGGGTQKSQPVIQYTKNGRDNQRWRITVDAANRVTFVSKKSGMCFDIQGGKVTNRAQMIQWPSNNRLNQKWVLNKK